MSETNPFPVVSEYAEYDELRELMAQDRRRRAATAAGQARNATTEKVQLLAAVARELAEHAHKVEMLQLAQLMHGAENYARFLRSLIHEDGFGWRHLSPRAHARNITRTAGQHDATARRYRRELVEANRAARRPVIKKRLVR